MNDEGATPDEAGIAVATGAMLAQLYSIMAALHGADTATIEGWRHGIQRALNSKLRDGELDQPAKVSELAALATAKTWVDAVFERIRPPR